MDKFKFIDWAATVSKYGYIDRKLKPKDKVVIKCPKCDSLRDVSFNAIRTLHGRPFRGLCSTCARKDTWANNVSYRAKQAAKQREKMLEVWDTPGYRDNQAKKHVVTTIKCWQNQEYRDKVVSGLKENYQNDPELAHKSIAPLLTPTARAKSKAAMDLIRQKPEYHKKLSIAAKRNWLKPGFREAVAVGLKIAWENPDLRSLISTSSKQNWEDQEYRKHAMAALCITAQDENHLLLLSNNAKALWANQDIKKKIIAAVIKSMARPSVRERLSESGKANWLDPQYREKMLKLYATPEYKAKASASAKRLWQNPIYASAVLGNINSKYEDQFAEMLNQRKVEYQRQFLIGPWSFDFFLPQHGLLIEINGDYFHRQSHQISQDAAKATFLNKYHPEFTLRVIWEHEFLTSNRVSQLLSEWLQLNGAVLDVPQTDFDFKDVEIKLSTAPSCVVFFSKYHYTASGGRSGVNITCYLGDTIIACARFCNPTRAESSERLGLSQQQLKELTRFAIHPSYQKKNFASWFLSRCIKILCKNQTIKCLLTFADQTHGHDGTIYKASNWLYDGTIPSDYYYVDNSGFIMHKRTLWGHASKMRMSELQYAAEFGYRRQFGKTKTRFLYWL